MACVRTSLLESESIFRTPGYTDIVKLRLLRTELNTGESELDSLPDFIYRF